jgi:23S rRNA (adenine-N6)-dimethyltransferase
VSGRRWRSAGAHRAQHFLGSARLAAELVEAVALRPDDLVVELGAGYGRLTEQLAASGARVVAVELDTRLAARLASRFRTRPNVTVVQGDALDIALPSLPFRVVSNPPFHLTSALLSRLLERSGPPLTRADMVLSWGTALALTGVFGPAHRSRRWRPRFEFLLVRHLPADLFDPAPAQAAALVSIRRTGLPDSRRPAIRQ